MQKKFIIDNHTHLNMEPLYENYHELAKICKQKNMWLNLIGCDVESSKKAIEVAKDIKFAKAFIGIHPNDVTKFKIEEIEKVFDELYYQNQNIVLGIGECGLDRKDLVDETNFELQIKWLKFHAKMANKYNIPIMLHIRYAYKDLINLWDQFNFKTQVIIHCFCGNKQEAKALLEKRCYISFAGIVTHKKQADEWAIDSIKEVPLDRIFVETDAPCLTPKEYRKSTNINMPFYIFETYSFIAEIKNIGFDELVDVCNKNYLNAYNLKEIKEN